MLKKILIPVLCFFMAISFCLLGKTPVFKGYAKTFQVYKSDSASSNFLTVNQSQFYFVGKIVGESVDLNIKDFCLQEFLQEFNAKVLLVEKIEQGASIYAFSPKIKYRQKVKEHTVNLHVFLGYNTVKVGTPLIYGSF